MLDFENLSSYMGYLASSVFLSAEQRAALQSSLVILKHQMKFSHLCFWGRIRGSQADYYIVQGVEGIDWYNRRTLFSQVCSQGFIHVLAFGDVCVCASQGSEKPVFQKAQPTGFGFYWVWGFIGFSDFFYLNKQLGSMLM